MLEGKAVDADEMTIRNPTVKQYAGRLRTRLGQRLAVMFVRRHCHFWRGDRHRQV